ncbi:unnamed protein product [Lymnaea stagnalis]|uniref:N-acetyltransferase domain-containing protein n=1 Tax=Lymnaea stagnalis TaxID=6523 RepID=A0AAV2IGU4_LYMST
MEAEDSSNVGCAPCYCSRDELNWEQVLHYKCLACGKRVHYGCIHSLQPSSLLDDTFFTFKCQSCGDEGKEEFQRSNISWHNVVMLTLYNLQKMGQGRCGYFHWKGHICAFIEAHWTMFFGHQRKKTTLWMGTIAGTLSSGCPQFFTSGTKVVDQGYWKLAALDPPMPRPEKKRNNSKKKISIEAQLELTPENRTCRRVRENALAAAIQLKEKKSFLKNNKDMKKQKRLETEEKLTTLREASDLFADQTDKPKKKKNQSRSADSPTNFDLTCSAESCAPTYLSDQDSNSLASSDLSLATSSSLSSSLKSSMKDSQVIQWDNDDFLSGIEVDIDGHEDLDIDIGSLDVRPSSPNLVDIFDLRSDTNCFEMSGKAPITEQVPPVEPKKEVTSDTESEGPSENNIDEAESSDSQDDGDAGDSESGKSDRIKKEVDSPMSPGDDYMSAKSQAKGRPRKRRRIDDSLPPSPPPRLKRISVFEEGELLQKLNILASKETLRTDLAQLRRKLICNQTNREFGLPVFDLEVQMNQLENMESSTLSKNHKTFFPKLKSSEIKETRDLDRFMMHVNDKKAESRNYTSFRQRLVGMEDHELKPVVSPYTTRVLLPFIWRNCNPQLRPVKMKLLQEIIAYPHRKDSSWTAPSPPPIDYCYVRPEHIPSVNALCREFFWPGIDMSECLQYPDFSCVVLYRKIVIAFAFMVPDRGYNEAYISFIFTHPEWRGAGIATFMLYHLIQTCMGKDVLLHVSTTNPAMLLYQKFGFKCQELILNFYHKYFPLNCKDSRHAFLMRLSR